MKPHSRQPRSAAADGFTFIELMAVVMILALTFAVVVPNLDSLHPSYALKAAAREIGAVIEMSQGESVGKRRTFAVAYDLGENTYRIVLPPGFGEDSDGIIGEDPADEEAGRAGSEAEPDVPFDSRESLDAEYLPRGIEFLNVILPGNEERSSGTVFIAFSPFGTEGSHIVHLKNERDEIIAVEFHALAGTLHFENGRRSFEEFVGGGEDGFSE